MKAALESHLQRHNGHFQPFLASKLIRSVMSPKSRSLMCMCTMWCNNSWGSAYSMAQWVPSASSKEHHHRSWPGWVNRSRCSTLSKTCWLSRSPSNALACSSRFVLREAYDCYKKESIKINLKNTRHSRYDFLCQLWITKKKSIESIYSGKKLMENF
jgi:hypothetical protein